MKPQSIILSIVLLSSFGCRKVSTTITPAFYHWKTVLELSEKEKSFLDTLQVQKLYVKFFDVDWDAGAREAVPLAQVIINDTLPDQLEIIPTIFITNRTFLNISEEKTGQLCDQIYDKVKQLAPQIPEIKIKEIQFDCDWTASTRQLFFSFLACFKEKIKEEQMVLSATIRLHQVKYFETTGVPPVESGMLMFYNTGDLENPTEENAILNIETAGLYLSRLEDYPIHLDLVLPLFSWAVVFRGEKMIKLISELNVEELADTTRFSEIASNRFEVKKSTYLNGTFLYKKDWFRLEGISSKLLDDSAVLLSEKMKAANRVVGFYHLDSTIIKRYPHEKIKGVYEHFSKN